MQILQIALQRDENMTEKGRFNIKAESGSGGCRNFSRRRRSLGTVMRPNNGSNDRRRQEKSMRLIGSFHRLLYSRKDRRSGPITFLDAAGCELFCVKCMIE